jgi:hypothetical protein
VGLGETWVEPMPVRIRGTDYPSAAAAARALGVSVSTVRVAIQLGRPDRVGLRSKAPNPMFCKPVVIAGLRFPSMAEASRALGFASAYVSHVLRRGSARQREKLFGAAMALRVKREAEARATRERAGRVAA